MVLDVFTILFEADTSKLEKGTKKSENATDKLNKKLKETDKSADNVGQSLKTLLATGLGAITAIASFAGIASGIFNTALYSDELAKNSKLLGENINDLAAYQDLATKAGGSADGLTSIFKNLNGQISEFALKGTSETLPYFQKLGVSLLDSEGKARKVSDILPELADSFEKLSKVESAGFGRKMGFDEGTITLLQSGRKALEENIKKQKELFSITKEQASVGEMFNDTMHDTKTAFRGLFLTIGGAVLPVLNFLLVKFQTIIVFLRNNGDLATGIFIALGAAISFFLLPPLYKMAIAAALAFAPFYLIGALVAAQIILFGLLYDDIMTFLDGGKSAFGSLLGWLGFTSDEIEALKNVFKNFGKIVSEILKKITLENFLKSLDFTSDEIEKVQEAFSVMGKMIGAVLDWISKKFEGTGSSISAFFSDLGGLLGDIFTKAFEIIEPVLFLIGKLIKGIILGTSGAIKAIGGFFGLGDDDEETTENRVNKKSKAASSKIISELSNANTNPINNAVSNSSNISRSSSVKIDKVEVVTQATDAKGISEEINNSLSAEIANANNNFDDGIKA